MLPVVGIDWLDLEVRGTSKRVRVAGKNCGDVNRLADVPEKQQLSGRCSIQMGYPFVDTCRDLSNGLEKMLEVRL